MHALFFHRESARFDRRAAPPPPKLLTRSDNFLVAQPFFDFLILLDEQKGRGGGTTNFFLIRSDKFYWHTQKKNIQKSLLTVSTNITIVTISFGTEQSVRDLII
jgi:hypothetical protein